MDEEIRRRLADLDQQVAELRDLLEAATAQIERQRQQHDSMRGQVRCPSCGNRSILQVDKVADRGEGMSHPMAVATKGLWNPKPVGSFACCICTNCGLVEWYVRDPNELDADGEVTRLLDVNDRDAGPYR